MSLINDALKKARQAQSATGATAAGPALRPVAPSRPQHNPIFTLPVAFGIIAVLTLSGVLLFEWFRSANPGLVVRANSKPAAVSPAIVNPPPPPVARPSPAPAPVVVAAPAPPPVAEPVATPIVETNSPPPAEANLVTDNSSATNEISVEAVPPDEPPINYTLQGIFYQPRQPGAMINGRTVYVGGHVGDARVVAIDTKTATIVTAAGRTNVLVLPEE